MGVRSFLRVEALASILEGCGVPQEYRRKVAVAINKYLMEGFIMKPKAGWKTTEFWITILASAGAVLGAVGDVIPPQVATIASAVLSAAYAIARGLAKTGAPPPLEPAPK